MSNSLDDLKEKLGGKADKIKTEKMDEAAVLEHYDINLIEEDEETINFLKEKTFEIHQITSKAYTKIGEIFIEAQDKLAENKTGTFEKWLNYLGYKKRNVYRLINRAKMARNNPEKKSLIESLPVSLSYEISAPSCPEELRENVLEGNVKTLKEFNELKKKMESSNLKLEEELIDVTPVTFEFIETKFANVMRTQNKMKKFIKHKEFKDDEIQSAKVFLEKIEKDVEKFMSFLGLNEEK